VDNLSSLLSDFFAYQMILALLFVHVKLVTYFVTIYPITGFFVNHFRVYIGVHLFTILK